MIPSSPAPTPEPTAFEQLIELHQASIWRYLRFLGCDPDMASDLTQDTFVSVFGKTVQRFGETGARAYLRRVAKNAYLKHLERADRRAEVDLELAESAYEWYRGDDDGTGWEAALEACLEELPDRARNALQLRFEKRYDRAELATCLGIGTHGVKSLLQRSYARLRVCIERRLDDARP